MKCPNPECENTELGENHAFCFVCGLKILKPNEETTSPSVDDKNKTPASNEEESDVQEDTDVSRGKTGEYEVYTSWSSFLLNLIVSSRKNEVTSSKDRYAIHFRFQIK